MTLDHPHHEDDEFIEPCFLDRSDWISAPPVFCAQQSADFLTHRVTRNPLDLMSHTQRIRLYRELGDADGTYGALLDLFTALGDKGERLRKRLLQQACYFLEASHYEALMLCLEKKLPESTPLPVSPHAVLSDEASTAPLVRQLQTTVNGRGEDPLETACDLLNSGQLQQAQTTLEAALLISPQREEVSLELLQIYRHTDNRNGCITMLNKLDNAPLAAHEQWVELILTLDQSNNEESSCA